MIKFVLNLWLKYGKQIDRLQNLIITLDYYIGYAGVAGQSSISDSAKWLISSKYTRASCSQFSCLLQINPSAENCL